MATGDPWCPTHGYSICSCYLKQTQADWSYRYPYDTGGNDYRYGTIKPLKPYGDFIPYGSNNTSIPVYTLTPHNRWTRMRVLIDEDWDNIQGFMTLSHYSGEIKFSSDWYNGTDNKIIINDDTDSNNYPTTTITWASNSTGK